MLTQGYPGVKRGAAADGGLDAAVDQESTFVYKWQSRRVPQNFGWRIAMLGKKLKSARLAKSYSLEDLARKTGFSKSFLSQIENAKNSPSIASLKKITQALEVSIGELFEADRGEQVYFLKKGERTPFEVVKDKVIFEFGASKVPNRKMEAIFFTLLPGGESEGEYTHEGEEFGTVVEGTLHLELGGREYVMEPGDSIYFSSSIPHRWKNQGGGPMRAVWVVTPPSF